MSRYVNRIPLGTADISFITARVGEFMTREGFSEVSYKGGLAWKKGVGLMLPPQYLVISYTQAEVVVEAFLKYALLPGVAVGELKPTSAFAGAIPRSLLMGRVQSIEQFLISLLAPAQPAPM